MSTTQSKRQRKHIGVIVGNDGEPRPAYRDGDEDPYIPINQAQEFLKELVKDVPKNFEEVGWNAIILDIWQIKKAQRIIRRIQRFLDC